MATNLNTHPGLDVIAVVEEEAKRRGMSRSAVASEALQRYFLDGLTSLVSVDTILRQRGNSVGISGTGAYYLRSHVVLSSARCDPSSGQWFVTCHEPERGKRDIPSYELPATELFVDRPWRCPDPEGECRTGPKAKPVTELSKPQKFQEAYDRYVAGDADALLDF